MRRSKINSYTFGSDQYNYSKYVFKNSIACKDKTQLMDCKCTEYKSFVTMHLILIQSPQTEHHC